MRKFIYTLIYRQIESSSFSTKNDIIKVRTRKMIKKSLKKNDKNLRYFLKHEERNLKKTICIRNV